jgi:hypothetical protein
MRAAILIATLMLAACGAAPDWENEQAELANELNATSPAADQSNVLANTDYLNATSPAANDVNVAMPAANETAPPLGD